MRKVKYEIALVSYLDILGFKGLIEHRSAGTISRIIRVVKETVRPYRFKTKIKGLPEDEFKSFSDLSIIVTPLRRTKHFVQGAIFSHLLQLIHSQATLLHDEGIAVRGGVTVGRVVKSYGQLFGPAIVRAYELESQHAKYPRIIIDNEVFSELESNPALWNHDYRSERAAVLSLLREDDDGHLFLDYLRVMQDELDDPVSQYSAFLLRHSRLIKERLARYEDNDKVLPKYEWLNRYHEATLTRSRRGQVTG